MVVPSKVMFYRKKGQKNPEKRTSTNRSGLCFFLREYSLKKEMQFCLFAFDSIYDKKTAKVLREKCPDSEGFFVHIFPYLDRKRENMDKQKSRIWILFMQCE